MDQAFTNESAGRPGEVFERSVRFRTLGCSDHEAYLRQPERKSILRFITCGSAGDGKSTLIGRLFDDSALDVEDHQAGAPTASLAVILIDARKGVLTQTRRHSYLVSLLGIREIVVAVNKLDLVDYSQKVFDDIEADYRAFADEIGLHDITCIPVSALLGDNVIEASDRMPWYFGPTLVHHLETVDVDDVQHMGSIPLPVQRVNRIGRGDVIAAAGDPPGVADQFECHIVWMSDEPMLPGRPYLLKLGAQTATATVAQPKYKVNVNSLEHVAARTLELDEIGVCNLSLDRPVAFEPYAVKPAMGEFILIDRYTRNPVAVGLLHFALRRAENVRWQAITVDKQARSAIKGQRGCVVWLTGLSGAGKSTIANIVEQKLHAMGRHTYLLDGDNVRHGLSRDLGFTDADRVENIRRVAEVAKLMVDAGIIVLASFISPFKAERRLARELVDHGEFIEVFVDSTLAVAEQRDTKGLYAKARRGELVHFTGIDSPYEVPEAPELRIDTSGSHTADIGAELIVEHLRRAGVFHASN